MPRRRASLGEMMLTSAPFTLMLRASGRSMPDRMLIRVDLPAPFSPSRQCTSPWRTVRLTRSFASTPGNRLVMSISSIAGTGSGDCLPATPASSQCAPAVLTLAYEGLHRGQGRRYRLLDLPGPLLLLPTLLLSPATPP